jgi:hypothetical protein
LPEGYDSDFEAVFIGEDTGEGRPFVGEDVVLGGGELGFFVVKHATDCEDQISDKSCAKVSSTCQHIFFLGELSSLKIDF